MKKEDLIRKWLDHSLSKEEWKAFKNLDAFSTLERIDAMAKAHRAPRLNKPKHFSAIVEKRSTESTIPWKRLLGGIAAVLLLGFFLLYLFSPSQTLQETLATETKTFLLPDTSEVVLNSGSQIRYQEDAWQKSRNLQLDGEAFFKVSKGQVFTVETNLGDVEVLGTQFNIFSRENLLEVTCFEGRVKVTYNNSSIYLSAGESFSSIQETSSNLHELLQPTWIKGISQFTSTPFHHVASEMERQYNIQITYPSTLKNSLFTGSFSDKNLEAALQAITIPFNLEYSMKGSTVMLKQRP